MTRFEEFCARKRSEYGDKFEPPTDQRFINAYNSGRNFRIKVRTIYGAETGEPTANIRWGFVSLTTGWKPAFLLIRREGQIGSSDVLGPRDEIIDCHYKAK